MSELKAMVDNNPKRTQLRKSFILTLADLVEKDPKIVLIVGDVGFSFMEPFKEKYPNQFLNAGIAEQNMMSMAAGMAAVGWKPYVYTMTNFILLRPLEQVRNDICYANANVKLFGVKGSAAYKFLGMSHNLYGTEEEDLLKNLPNITTYFPEDEDNVERIMREEYERLGPSYMRI